ncbi:MAG: D-alanine-D-alanine ligase, partial [Solirubrobacteraceae bacterium]|nr:D-alanine-D-alanine ligase [Solirubrobacteraceae bacterium]
MRVAVLAGGRSSEHEVSLASASSVREGLERAGHEAVWVDLATDGTWWHDGEEVELRAGRGLLGADAVFPALHGPFGEDGTVQGLLELLDVAYVGSGVLASAVCMDKVVFKELMARAGLPQVGFAAVDEAVVDGAARRISDLGLPCWVKPARLGSSVGIVRVADAGDLDGALRTAFAHDPRVIVEASAPGVEVECSVLGHTGTPEASDPGEIVLLKGDGWYDYEAKYADGGMELVVPARISETARERVRELAVTAFRLAGCSGLARADFFVDGETVLLNELNTMP